MKFRHLTILTEPEGYSEKAKAMLEKFGPVFSWAEVKNKENILAAADILAVKLGVKISNKFLSSLPNLKVIGTSTTGLNHIDLGEAKRRGIKIISLRDETKFLRTITPTAEETLGLMIMLTRNLPWGFDAVRRGRWEKEKLYGHELNGKTLGVLGFGRLGSMVAKIARSFGMKIVACDPHVSKSAMTRGGAVKVSMDELFRKSDAVTVHVLLTDKTRALVKRRHFKLMKPTAYFINTARGELIDEKALLEALQKKWIAGAALDVLADEDPQGHHVRHHPLVRYATSHQNLIIVPHLGGATLESMQKTEDFIAAKILEVLKKK